MERLHLIIRGKVHGVFFRATTKREADKLGLRGWVRNNKDGSVELMADGERERLEKLLAFCREGSEPAQVESVDEEWLKPEHVFEQFVIY